MSSTATTPPGAAPAAPKTPEEIERHWFENVYQGDKVKQLTLRAGLMGCLLGGIMAASNVYVSLQSGWSMGVAITSCILAYTIFTGLQKIFPRWFPPFTILENNAMQSAASAAGSMTSAGVANAIPALLMLNPAAFPTSLGAKMMMLVPWAICISWLGVFLAVPAKRQYINVEQLPYPSGTAAAATLRGLHSHGGEAARQARSLGLAALLGAIIAWWRDARADWIRYPNIPNTWGTGWIKVGTYKGGPLSLQQLTMSFQGSLLFVAAGSLMSIRQTWSMLLGAVVNYVILAPMMLNAGIIATPSFRAISSWSLWIGVPMMVTSGLLLFFLNWKSMARAFRTVTDIFKPHEHRSDDPMEKIEVPGSWFIFGFLAVGAATVFLGHAIFHITWWMGIIAVLATFFLVVVAARVTGETDTTPVGPISKITQLTFGAIKPGDVTVNLMTANITAGAVSHAGDLLTDLKSGYLLGANPRQQFLAQFFGVMTGAFVVIPVFFILIPDVSMLATERWPAPAALVWKGVAELLAKGPSSLHPTARIGLVIGGLLGLILPLLELRFPRAKKFIPSPTGLGLAFTINGFNVVMMFLGSVAALILRKQKPKVAEAYAVPVASGIIAGESLMGVTIAFLTVFKILH